MDRDVACQHRHWQQLLVCLVRLGALSSISDEFLQRNLTKLRKAPACSAAGSATPQSVLPGQQTLMHLLAEILDLIHRIHSMSLIWEKKKKKEALISLCYEVCVVALFEGDVQLDESSPAATHHALAKTASCIPCRCPSGHVLEG